MITSKFVLSFTLFFVILLAACSPETGKSETMSGKDPNTDPVMVKMEDDTASEPSKSNDEMAGADMSKDKKFMEDEDMAFHNDESMMDEGDDGMENKEALNCYKKDHGFDWNYSVAPIELARQIGQLYGDQFLNPPSTPMLIIDRDGEVHPLPFGIKDAVVLFAALKPYLDGEM